MSVILASGKIKLISKWGGLKKRRK